MNNINTQNDWFATSLLNNNATPDQLIVSGITPENSVMQSPEFYKSKAKVREKFTKDDGSFDENAFNKFYLESLTYYQYLNGVNTENYILSTYEKSASNFTTDFGVFKQEKMAAQFNPNSYHQSLGVVGINKLSEIEFSQRELAQMNYSLDSETGQWSEKTVNEGGLFGLLSKDLMYATWDSDGYHINPITKEQVFHEAGEWKTDAWGEFYTETAGNTEAINKQFVKWSEVLTDDSGIWNTIDIFDSDSLETSIPKTVFKSAATVAAFLNPWTGPYVTYATAAIALARTLPQITKTFYSLFNEDVEFDKLNEWDNYMQKFKASKSDYAQKHFLAFENIMDMAVSSFTQLSQQRAIGEIPSKLKGFKNAQQAIKDHANKVLMNQVLNKGDEALSLTDEMVENLVKASSKYKELKGSLDQYEKLSKIISRGYLIATSTEDTYNIARSYGFDTQTSSVISLVTMAAVGTLFSTDYFRGMLYNTSDYEIERDIKILVKNYLQNNKSKMAHDAAEIVSDTGTQGFFKKHGKAMTDFFKTHFSDVNSGRFGISTGMINEALEETSEELAADAAIQIGKGWNRIKSAFTGNEYTDNYSYEKTDPLKRYATAFAGGAFGGAIFKISDRIHFDKEAFHNWHKMLGDNNQIMNELLTYVTQGKKDFIINEIEKLEKSPMISGNLSVLDGKPTNIQAETQNNVLFNSFKKAINDLDTFFTNHNLKIDRERFEDIELLKGLRVAWVKSKGLSNSLFNEYLNETKKVGALFSELQHVEATLSTVQTEEEKIPLKTKIKEINKNIEEHKNVIRKLVNGEDDSYIGRLMMESNPHLASSILPTSKDELSMRSYHTAYDKLDAAFKAEIDKEHQNLVDSGILEIKYYKAWELYKSIANVKNYSDLITKKYEKNIGLLSQKMISQDGKLDWARNGVSSKNIDYKNPYYLFPLISQILKSVHDFKSEDELNYAALAAAGISTIPDYISAFVDEYDAPTIGNWDEGLEEAIKNIKNKLSELKTKHIDRRQKYTEQYKNVQSKEDIDKIQAEMNKEDEFFIYLWNTVDEGNVEDLFNIIEMTIENNSTFIPEIETVSLDHVYALINNVSEKLGSKPLNIKEFLLFLQMRSANLGKDFRIEGATLNQLIELKEMINVAKTIISGAYNEYSSIANAAIPMGANNFINDASKEKNFGFELLQLDKDQVEVTTIKLDAILNDINNIIYTAAENERQVITEQMRSSLQYDRQRITQLIDFGHNILPNIDPKVFIDITSIDDLPLKFENMSIEDMLKWGITMRQVLVGFEEKFYNFLNKTENKTQVIKKIAEYCDKDSLTLDLKHLKVIDENDKVEGILFGKTELWHYLQGVSYNHLSDIANNYKGYVNELKATCPFDSQEQVITQVMKFLYRDRNVSSIWNSQIEVEGNIKHLNHCVKLMAAAGTGKSSTILSETYHMILHSDLSARKCVFTANTQRQLDDLSVTIKNASIKGGPTPEFMLHSNLIKKLLYEKDESVLNEYKNSIIFMDECTYINQDTLVKLDEICENYGIDIIYSGDNDQGGVHELNIDNCSAYSTPILIDSFRALSDIMRYNLRPWKEVITTDSEGNYKVTLKEFKQEYWKKQGQTFSGIYIESAIQNMDVNYIDSFIQQHPLLNGGKVLIFTNQDSNTFKNLITKYKDLGIEFDVISDFEQIQGAQWEYVFSDQELSVNFKNDSDREAINKYRDIYTLISRPKHGLVSFKQPKISKNGATSRFMNKESNTPPVETGLTNEAISNFITFKKAVLDAIKYSKSSTSKMISRGSELSETTILSDTSVAQCTPGFSYDPDYEYWKSLGYSNLDQIKMTIINGITTNSDWKNMLPENLRNGEILVTYMETDVVELRNLGNKKRDDKNVENVHPWLVYSIVIDGERRDIHLGMFHNIMGTIVQNLSPTPATDVVNYPCNDSTKKDKYFRLKEGTFTITRNSNPLAIQDNETNSNVSVKYENGVMTAVATVSGNPYGYISTSQAFYNDLAASDKLPMNEIKGALNVQRSLYKTIFPILQKKYNIPGKVTSDKVTSDKLGQEINELLELELIGFTRPTSEKPGFFRAKNVVDINHKFISFVRLNSLATQDNSLEHMSNEYLAYLKAKNSILEQVISLLKDNENSDFATLHSELQALLSKKINSEVTVLTYDPEYVTNVDELAGIFDGLIREETVTGRRVKSYNNAVANQLGLILQRIAALYTSTDLYRDFGITKGNDDYITPDLVSKLKSAFDKHIKALLEEFKTFSNITDENTLKEAFFNFLKTNIVAIEEDKPMELPFIEFLADPNSSQAFRQFFKEVLLDQKTDDFDWADFLYKSNGLQYSTKKGTKAKENNPVYFGGHIYGRLIKDNGFNLKEYGPGKMYLVSNSASLNMDSKVVQPAQIHIHIKNGNVDEMGVYFDSVFEEVTTTGVKSNTESESIAISNTNLKPTEDVSEEENYQNKFVSEFSEKFSSINIELSESDLQEMARTICDYGINSTKQWELIYNTLDKFVSERLKNSEISKEQIWNGIWSNISDNNVKDALDNIWYETLNNNCK